MHKIFKQWAGSGILALLGLGADMIPGNDSWLPSIIIWSIAFVWFIGTIIYYVTHRTHNKIEAIECSLEVGKPYYVILKVITTISGSLYPLKLASLKLYIRDIEIGEPLRPILPVVIENGIDSVSIEYEVRASLIGKENTSYISALARGKRFMSNKLPIPYDSPLLPQVITSNLPSAFHREGCQP